MIDFQFRKQSMVDTYIAFVDNFKFSKQSIKQARERPAFEKYYMVMLLYLKRGKNIFQFNSFNACCILVFLFVTYYATSYCDLTNTT